MAEPFRGQILPVAFAFAPSGWAKCDGQLLLTAQNPELFKLIGTTYGGNGDNTFAPPDLRGRAPIHQGGGAGLTRPDIRSPGGAAGGAPTPAQPPPTPPPLLGPWGPAAAPKPARGR